MRKYYVNPKHNKRRKNEMRKFIQLTPHDTTLVGLCDDGTTWWLDSSKWSQLPLLPQDPTIEVKFNPTAKEEVKKPTKPKTLYWYHAESDSCGIAKDEDDLISICDADGLSSPCSKAVYDKCMKANEETTEEAKTYTHDDLKQACLTSARADSKNRDKLKALLKTYDAVKAVDVPVDKLEEVIGKIESGDF